MIDSGAIENFITKKYIENRKYLTQIKQYLYGLISLNNISLRNNQRQINKKIIFLSVVFQKYHEELIFDVINIINYNIILRILWLRKYNPQIN